MYPGKLILPMALLWAMCFGATGSKDTTREPGAMKPGAAFKEIQDVAGLPRVLLIGDSISIGYTFPVRHLLEGKANVHRALENCGPTTRGLEHLDRWLGDGKWDVIHFNFGLHDLKYMDAHGDLIAVDKGKQQVPLAQYEQNLRQLVDQLKKTGAKLIWATTTPVPSDAPGRVAGDEVKYNQVATKVMEENHIPIDDLFAAVQPQIQKMQRPHDVHYLPAGYQILAEHVAASIEDALKK